MRSFYIVLGKGSKLAGFFQSIFDFDYDTCIVVQEVIKKKLNFFSTHIPHNQIHFDEISVWNKKRQK